MLTLVCIVGVVLGLVHRHRTEKPLTIMVISLGVLGLVSFAGYVVEPVIYGLFASLQGGGRIVSGFLMLWQAFAALVQAGATAGLIAAVLYDREIEVLNFSRPQQTTASQSP